MAYTLAAPSWVPSSKDTKITKQYNRINNDGSYTFGYEADDGTFRSETRDLTGYVIGKYGYIDEKGQLKVVEYETGKRKSKVGSEEKTEDSIPLEILTVFHD